MGCYIGVAKRDGEELPDFRQDKWTGNRAFLDIIASGPYLSIGPDFDMLRPDASEFPRIELAIASSDLDNRELFGQMLVSLAANPDHWLKVSY